MSLDDNEKLSRSIKGFADSDSFRIITDGTVVLVKDTSTWAGVFENGLSLDYIIQMELTPEIKYKPKKKPKKKPNPPSPVPEEDYCSCCGKKESEVNLDPYLSSFSDKRSLLCLECANSECCQGCGMESGGDLCRGCRHDY